jgi:hypothetical protein
MPDPLAWIFKTLREFATTWSRGDAIRSSATDRMWLSLKPPCVVLWQGERIEVLNRNEIASEQGVCIQWECLTPRGREFLVVSPGGLHQPPALEWRGEERKKGR